MDDTRFNLFQKDHKNLTKAITSSNYRETANSQIRIVKPQMVLWKPSLLLIQACH